LDHLFRSFEFLSFDIVCGVRLENSTGLDIAARLENITDFGFKRINTKTPQNGA
jgi:hypothetical protein